MKVIHRFKTYRRDSYVVGTQRTLKWKKEACLGLCDPPMGDEEAFIKLIEGQGRRQLTETVIHEMAHAFFPDACESNVNHYARATLTLLKKLGLV